MSDSAGDCPFAQHVDAYCDGELPAALEEEMHRHVFACAGCAAAVRQTKDISDAISSIETRRLPERVRSQMHESVSSRWDYGALRLAKWMSGIAAVVLVGASIWVARMGGVSPVNTAPPSNSTDMHVAQWIVKDLSSNHGASETAPAENGDGGNAPHAGRLNDGNKTTEKPTTTELK